MTTTGAEYYEIRVRGQLDSHWNVWFEGLKVTPLENGNTLIAGQVQDQAALHGILAKIRDLDLHLLLVVCNSEKVRNEIAGSSPGSDEIDRLEVSKNENHSCIV